MPVPGGGGGVLAFITIAVIDGRGSVPSIYPSSRAREQTPASLGQPLLERVNRWLPMVTGDAYSEIEVDSKTMRPSLVVSPAYRKPVDLGGLSYGTLEQIFVLFRLALGSVIGEKKRQLVVLDDWLVNADLERLERLCSVLEDASQRSCQVLLATCNEAPYRSRDANVVQIPDDGLLCA